MVKMGLGGHRGVDRRIGWSVELSGRVYYLREICGNGKTRSIPLLTVSWMGELIGVYYKPERIVHQAGESEKSIGVRILHFLCLN